MRKLIALIFVVASAGVLASFGQLAITEVMTGEADATHPDWWELTNYGSTNLDLTGYSWNDDSHGGLAGSDTNSFTGVIIHPGESIIATEIKGDVTDAATFRQWWGLSSSVQVVVLNAADPGLGDTGDSVRLWSTNAAAYGGTSAGVDLDQAPEFLVQRVDTIDIKTPGADGRTLTYNPADGSYSVISTNGVAGAFTAATTADVGSPGFAPSLSPATITQAPGDQTKTVGDTVSFSIASYALPPLTYEWSFKGVLLDSRVAGVVLTSSRGTNTLTLTGIQATNAGTYTVVAANGLERITNSAVLTVNSKPAAPIILSVSPQQLSFDSYPGQTPVLSVTVSGFPAPTYRWQFNNGDIAGQITNQLALALDGTNQSGMYTVVVSNEAGSTNLSFNLRVTSKPNLVITEVMSSESTNNISGDTSGHNDWFELSNFDSFVVNLAGFRIDDSKNSLAQSATVTNQTFIQPGEAVVFVQNMSEEAFRTWWGPNLPGATQIVSYDGSGQGLSGTKDDVHIWNAAAVLDNDQVTGVNFLAATNGVSFGFNPAIRNQTGFLGFGPDGLSVESVNGAFAASIGGDIGSPGTITYLPRFTGITATPAGLTLAWANEAKGKFTVEFKQSLSDSAWTVLTNVTTDSSSVFTVSDPAPTPPRFYRLSLAP